MTRNTPRDGRKRETDDEWCAGGAEETDERRVADGGERSMSATRYADGSVGYPGHPVGPDGAEPVGTVDLSDRTAEVVTWTTAHATPPGVEAPNHLAIVAFDVEDETVRAIGQLTTGDVSIGDEVQPVYAPELRDPDAGIRDSEAHEWGGFRFEPVDDADGV